MDNFSSIDEYINKLLMPLLSAVGVGEATANKVINFGERRKIDGDWPSA